MAKQTLKGVTFQDGEHLNQPENSEREFEVWGLSGKAKVFWNQEEIELVNCEQDQLRELYDSGLRQYIRVKEAK